MDSEFSNEAINLQTEFITPATVNGLFEKYNVPVDVDYVSIDIDSTDLWVFKAVVSGYSRPRVITVEYNCHFPYTTTLTCSSDCRWRNEDRIFGASVGALKMVGEAHGYTLVGATEWTDLFFIRSDLIEPHVEPVSEKVFRDLNVCLTHQKVEDRERLFGGEIIDYQAYVGAQERGLGEEEAAEVARVSATGLMELLEVLFVADAKDFETGRALFIWDGPPFGKDEVAGVEDKQGDKVSYNLS